MVWSLEIHHLDIGQGDSTLFVARNDGVGLNQQAQTRSVLIDGGLLEQADTVNRYIRRAWPNGAGLSEVDVVVATHYDQDHFNGLRGALLLSQRTTMDNAIIYDQGEQGTINAKRKADGTVGLNLSNTDPNYALYVAAIGSRGARRRMTEKVYSEETSAPSRQVLNAADWGGPNHLVGTEIMWRDENDNVIQPADLIDPVNTNYNLNQNPPTITCIAANQYVQGRNQRVAAGIGVDPRNEMSLAFLVQFNNFKYYVGGDIETVQEDEIQKVLNPGNNDAGRVLAMKASHHGSDRSTSAAFLARLRPQVAFISSAYEKKFGNTYLPRDSVLANLENCATLQRYYMTRDRQQDTFETRVGQIVDPAGPNIPGNVAAAYTAKAVVCGGWAGAPYNYDVPLPSPRYGDIAPNTKSGHAVLFVTEAESQRAASGALPPGQTRFRVEGYTADAMAQGRFVHVY